MGCESAEKIARIRPHPRAVSGKRASPRACATRVKQRRTGAGAFWRIGRSRV